MNSSPSQGSDDWQTLGPDLGDRLQDRFGLAADPFSDNHGYFFSGARRGHALNSIRHLAAFGDRVLWLYGADGAGKSRLVAEFCRLERDNLDIRSLGGSQLESRDALAAALSDLSQQKVAPDSTAQGQVDAFFRWSEALPARGRRLVLLVDDNATMADDCLLSLLGGFVQAKRGHAAIPLIVREYSVQGLLQGTLEEQLQGHVHQIELPPLDRRDIASYLEQAFRHAGADSLDGLDDATLEKLEAVSGGNIGLLQQKAPAIMLGLVRGRRPSSGRSSRRLWGWLLLVVLLLAGSFVLISIEYQQVSRPSANATTEPPAKPREMIHLALNTNRGGPRTGEKSLRSETGSADRTSSVEGPPAAAPTSAMTDILTSAPPLNTDTSRPAEALSSSQVVSRTANMAPRQSGKEGIGAPRSAPGGATQAGAPRAAPSDREVTAPAATSGPQSGRQGTGAKQGGVSARSSAPAATPPVSAIPTLNRHETPNNGVKSVSQEAGGFTASLPAKYTERAKLDRNSGFIVQLSGSYSEHYAVRALRRFSDLDLHYTRTRYRAKPWFVVFMGPYPSLDQARAALKSLPHQLRTAGPWIRRAKGL